MGTIDTVTLLLRIHFYVSCYHRARFACNSVAVHPAGGVFRLAKALISDRIESFTAVALENTAAPYSVHLWEN